MYLLPQSGAANSLNLQCAGGFTHCYYKSGYGYRINNHNLSRLLNLTQLFTDDLAEVFAVDDSQSKQLFNLLKNACVNVRYKDDFEAEPVEQLGQYAINSAVITLYKNVLIQV